MADDASSCTPRRIDAAELSWVEVTDDGRRLCLRLRDPSGRAFSVSLPLACLNSVLAAVPPFAKELLADKRQVHTLDSWSLGQDRDGLVLTLHLADGAIIAFAVKPWQIAAMASLAGVAPQPSRLN